MQKMCNSASAQSLCVGTYQELVDKGVDFASLVSKKKTEESASAESEETEEEEEADAPDAVSARAPSLEKKMSSKLLRRESSKLVRAKSKENAKLVESEERETGSVSREIYWIYFLACGGIFFVSIVIGGYVISELARVSGDLWLSVWTTPLNETSFAIKDPPPFGETRDDFFLYIYIILGVSYSAIIYGRNVLTGVAGINSSKSLHAKLFANILKAPVAFFDVTPIGRILNRFTKDLDNVDNLLPMSINQFLGTVFTCISTLLVIAYVTPLFMAALIPILIVYLLVMQYYRHTSRELQRLDSISRSPIYTHFSETLSGVDTIRAYRFSERFTNENFSRINYNMRAYWMVQVMNRWLSLRLEVLGTLITFSAAIFSVVARDTINPSLAGLSITYALQVTGMLNWVVRMATQCEAQMNAVERVHYYGTTENEAPWVIPENRPPPNWPVNATVIMKNVSMRYRIGLEPVLKNVSFEIRDKEKIGVVGRTGAGKSSLMLVLFRIAEIFEGQVLIDNVDISKIGLHDLRSRLAIIPQDPVLFSGTVRSNLDPFAEYTDQEVWTALDHVHLKKDVEKSPEGLLAEVSENGSNWSLGQRQLFCFARALLKKTKVLVMDEATSSVDMETDNLIQKTIRTEFSDRTVLTIAHRLSTIMDSDRVIVMDAGRIVEFDTPANLLKNPDGVFTTMVNQTGAKTAQFLKQIANKQIDVFGNYL